jgi:hypothetical protein
MCQYHCQSVHHLSGKRRVSYSQAPEAGGMGSKHNTEALLSLEGEFLITYYAKK